MNSSKDREQSHPKAKEAECDVCFRHCRVNDGKTGFCRGRGNEAGKIVCTNYGRLTSLALDPIEKKPLNDFFPGSLILSCGSYGCNLSCPFCQNHEISMADSRSVRTNYYTPAQLAELAEYARQEGNIGIAFTYNEPLIGWEFVRDTAKAVHEKGMKNVLVTNGTADLHILDRLLPFIDAMNIDLKAFHSSFYDDFAGGSFEMTKYFIEHAVSGCHVELTTLLIPGKNDSEEEIRQEAEWIADLQEKAGRAIPLHLTRFFPMYKMQDSNPTDIDSIYRLADIAREYLPKVYTGNC